ncbi:FhaA domain-containing protein [Microbacterium album]|uniref:FHA domain-containing protein n=1 Tax=Microbacterium album TaxID=2053191 RepID=A0A917MLT4_9MICO|nr:DUF3662 and FHA domain-containing protein [Microbacterium album]GGH44558.1 hypothetical protein GCM10010921_19290 [Microbacterium album]
MGLLDSFEQGLERAVNRAFAKTFRSGIQPVEIASALRRELDTKAAVVTRDRILVPSNLTVRLSPADEERMRSLGGALINELHEMLQRHATDQGYSFAGPVRVSLRADSGVTTGTVAVDSSTAEGRIEWRAVVDVEGRRHPLSKARTVIGRGSDADITVSDPGTSRAHVEVLWDGERAMMRDLGSTNGSKLDGIPTKQSALRDGQTITIGRTSIVFRVVPLAEPGTGTTATRIFDARNGDLA